MELILNPVATAPGTDMIAIAAAPRLLLAIFQSESEEILKKDSAVTRFVRVFPTRRVLVPILERLFQMKLNGIDQLTVRAFGHHLIAAQI